MTVNSIREITRRFLQDTVETYRWSDSEIRKAIQLGIREVNRKRPDTRYVAGQITDGILLPTGTNADTTPIDMEDRYEEALACYAAHICYLNDSPDTTNTNLAASYLSKFAALV